MALIVAMMIALLFALAATAAEDHAAYSVGKWPPSELGNHRARLRVDAPADAVWAHIPWRRRDADPQDKDLVVVQAATGKRIGNVVGAKVAREAGDIIFQAAAPGEYYVYFMPCTAATEPWGYATRYLPPSSTADPAWVERSQLTTQALAGGRWQVLPKATLVDIQARTEFDRFDPMEVIATAGEVENLLARHPREAYLLFPEDREHPVRMRDNLPLRWVENRPSDRFEATALRGEFFAFQAGVYAAAQSVDDLRVTFSDLRSDQGLVISASAFDAFTLGGIDWLGREFERPFAVAKGTVGTLWFGVQVPSDVSPGDYHGALTFQPKNAPARSVQLSLTVSPRAIENHGDNDLWRQARLRWLDSTIGLDDEVVAPYTPLTVRGRTVQCLGRQVRFAPTGLPESITSNGFEILARPMALVAEACDSAAVEAAELRTGELKVTKQGPGAVICESESACGSLSIASWSKMEADGYLNYRVRVRAQKAMAVGDIRLEIPIRREIATYMMGLGRTGGFRPKEWDWSWDVRRANNTLWIGEVAAGLYCKLKDPEDSWSLGALPDVPNAWGNNGKGGCTVREERDSVLVRAYSGPRTMKAGEELEFCFGLLITPVKPLDPAHWRQRYFHSYAPPQQAVDSGATIINIHHGNDINPNINYPFPAADDLAAYVKEAHARGLKVKIYYTVRELSNRVAEMWALRSLGAEIFSDGRGGGHSWLCEHLVDHYAPAWHHTFADGEVDAAIATTSLSRWHNYYLEGLGWLLREVEIDGLYLDGIGYNREIMKRVRKVMNRVRPGCLIDFHSGNDFTFNDRRVSPACEYMEHFPYIDSLWFGEGYDYNQSPDYWLVEISGIPFGLFGDMLQDNGNPWRGMVYGMTARYYSGADPKHLWKLWDEFGIEGADMIGYWDAKCPVKTDHQDILATVYRKPDRTLVAVASWARDSLWGKQPVRCRLKVDWTVLGLNPQTATITAPAIPGFQDAATFNPGDEIPVESGRGWLLIISKREQ
jgi:hypothetical protein